MCVCLAGFLWIAQHLKRNAFYGSPQILRLGLSGCCHWPWPQWYQTLEYPPQKKISNGSATNQIIQYSLSNHRESETQSVFQIEQIHQQRQLWLWHWVWLSASPSLSLSFSLPLTWHQPTSTTTITWQTMNNNWLPAVWLGILTSLNNSKSIAQVESKLQVYIYSWDSVHYTKSFWFEKKYWRLSSFYKIL